jgi:hypothetical protein
MAGGIAVQFESAVAIANISLFCLVKFTIYMFSSHDIAQNVNVLIIREGTL